MHNRQVPRYVIKQIGKAKHNKAKERKAMVSKRCHNLSANAPRSLSNVREHNQAWI